MSITFQVNNQITKLYPHCKNVEILASDITCMCVTVIYPNAIHSQVLGV